MSEGQTWKSEDIRLYSFTVFFGPWQALVMGAGSISKAPMCADRLEAVNHWLAMEGLFLAFSGNGYCGIQDK
jgi:hypothetical protein